MGGGGQSRAYSQVFHLNRVLSRCFWHMRGRIGRWIQSFQSAHEPGPDNNLISRGHNCFCIFIFPFLFLHMLYILSFSLLFLLFFFCSAGCSHVFERLKHRRRSPRGTFTLGASKMRSSTPGEGSITRPLLVPAPLAAKRVPWDEVNIGLPRTAREHGASALG